MNQFVYILEGDDEAIYGIYSSFDKAHEAAQKMLSTALKEFKIYPAEVDVNYYESIPNQQEYSTHPRP